MKAVRYIIEYVIDEHKVPGFALAIARGLERPTQPLLGTDSDDMLLPQDSLLPVASITKLATALAVLHLGRDKAGFSTTMSFVKIVLDLVWHSGRSDISVGLQGRPYSCWLMY